MDKEETRTMMYYGANSNRKPCLLALMRASDAHIASIAWASQTMVDGREGTVYIPGRDSFTSRSKEKNHMQMYKCVGKYQFDVYMNAKCSIVASEWRGTHVSTDDDRCSCVCSMLIEE
ncbi:hypothetical protein CBL_05785 [Carabus blaptoides fortunei]